MRDAHDTRPALGDAALKGALAAIADGLLRLHPPMLIRGLLLGALVYAANPSSAAVLPSAGIVPAVGAQSPRQRGLPLAAHAAFRLATAAHEALT